MSRTRQHYTPEFKFQVVLEVLREEQTVAEIAVKHHTSRVLFVQIWNMLIWNANEALFEAS